MDRLAARGVRFTHAYIGTWCMPPRVTMFTGLHQYGAKTMRMEVEYPGSEYDPEQCREDSTSNLRLRRLPLNCQNPAKSASILSTVYRDSRPLQGFSTGLVTERAVGVGRALFSARPQREAAEGPLPDLVRHDGSSEFSAWQCAFADAAACTMPPGYAWLHFKLRSWRAVKCQEDRKLNRRNGDWLVYTVSKWSSLRFGTSRASTKGCFVRRTSPSTSGNSTSCRIVGPDRKTRIGVLVRRFFIINLGGNPRDSIPSEVS